MIAFPHLLVEPAHQAGILVPNDADKYDRKVFPHFAVFCRAQLGRPMPSPRSHWENAEVIAAVPDSQITTITMEELVNLGFA